MVVRTQLSAKVKRLDRAFNPKTVAVIGDKKALGYIWLRALSTFQGKVYSVQIDPKEFPGIEELGVPNYLSLLDIPEPVDYAIASIPRAAAPKVVEDCIKKGVGGVAFYTSGFAETNTEEGRRLQAVITEMAQKAGLNLIGPNCVGIFNPRIGLRHTAEQYAGKGGPVGFISQSGTHATLFSQVGALHGVRVSKSVSYGNAVILDSSDYLEYLGQDEETRIIGLYVEGVKKGRAFFRTLREVAPRKPVLIWKGGLTAEGTRATASHTGQLAESPAIWEALIKQTGAIRVDSLEEMIDTIKALLYLRPTTGGRVGLVAMTGGHSVVLTDAFARAGLEVPLLSEGSYRKLASFYTIIGASYRNPFDMSGGNFFWVERSAENVTRTLDILEEEDSIDSVVLELPLGLGRRWERESRFWEDILQAVSLFKKRSKRPFLTILVAGVAEAPALEMRQRLVEMEVATFPSFERGARALKKVVEYYRFRQNQLRGDGDG